MTQLEGLKNFAENIKPTMLRVAGCVNEGRGKPAKLSLSEQNSILQFYLEVVDYLSKG